LCPLRAPLLQRLWKPEGTQGILLPFPLRAPLLQRLWKLPRQHPHAIFCVTGTFAAEVMETTPFPSPPCFQSVTGTFAAEVMETFFWQQHSWFCALRAPLLQRLWKPSNDGSVSLICALRAALLQRLWKRWRSKRQPDVSCFGRLCCRGYGNWPRSRDRSPCVVTGGFAAEVMETVFSSPVLIPWPRYGRLCCRRRE